MTRPRANPAKHPTEQLLEDLGELIIDGRLVKASKPDELPALVETPKEADDE